jgi:hypothetical protein
MISRFFCEKALHEEENGARQAGKHPDSGRIKWD